jgi:hypothetical protein
VSEHFIKRRLPYSGESPFCIPLKISVLGGRWISAVEKFVEKFGKKWKKMENYIYICAR